MDHERPLSLQSCCSTGCDRPRGGRHAAPSSGNACTVQAWASRRGVQIQATRDGRGARCARLAPPLCCSPGAEGPREHCARAEARSSATRLSPLSCTTLDLWGSEASTRRRPPRPRRRPRPPRRKRTCNHGARATWGGWGRAHMPISSHLANNTALSERLARVNGLRSRTRARASRVVTA